MSDLSVNDIKATLEKMAKIRNVTVDELIESAESAGPSGPAYLIRVLNLTRRLEKLQAGQ